MPRPVTPAAAFFFSSPKGFRWTPALRLPKRRPPQGAQVAQLVEQRTENPRVGGSNPPLGTISSTRLPETPQKMS